MKKFVFILVSVLFMTATAFAQDTITQKQWRKQQKSFLLTGRPWTVEAPLWIPGFAGSFAYGDINIEGEDGVDPENPVEPPPGGGLGEIISRLFTKNWYLKFFFLTRIAYEKNRFIVQVDAISGAVGNSVKFNYNDTQIVSAVFRTVNLRFFAGYKIINSESKNAKFRYELFGYLGTRAYFQNIYSSLGGGSVEMDIHPAWIEPIIGLQNQFRFKRWMIVLQGDYGGFLDQKKYSVQLSTYVYYRTGRLTSLKLGWNHLVLDHHGIFLNEEYRVKATFSGPAFALVFHF